VAGWGDGALINQIGPLPVLTLPQLAVAARLVQGGMMGSMHWHHIRTARPVGLSNNAAISRQALRDALLPIISCAGPAAAEDGKLVEGGTPEAVMDLPQQAHTRRLMAAVLANLPFSMAAR
jgi:hypothetical protein